MAFKMVYVLMLGDSKRLLKCLNPESAEWIRSKNTSREHRRQVTKNVTSGSYFQNKPHFKR